MTDSFTIEQLQIAVQNGTVASLLKEVNQLQHEKDLLEIKKKMAEDTVEKPNVSEQIVLKVQKNITNFKSRLNRIDTAIAGKNKQLIPLIENMLK